MKKITFLIVFFTTLGCSKKNTYDYSGDLNDKSLLKIETIIKSKNPVFQRVALKVLSNSEKNLLWKQHLDNLLPHFKNQVQKYDFIKYIANKLTPEMFTTDNSKYLSDFAIDEYKAGQLFSKDENLMLFYSLNNDYSPKIQTSFVLRNSNQSLEAVSESESGNTCFCNADGDPNQCTYTWIGGYIYCAKSTSCTTEETGCGWFWLNKCNGNCQTVYY